VRAHPARPPPIVGRSRTAGNATTYTRSRDGNGRKTRAHRPPTIRLQPSYQKSPVGQRAKPRRSACSIVSFPPDESYQVGDTFLSPTPLPHRRQGHGAGPLARFHSVACATAPARRAPVRGTTRHPFGNRLN